MNPMKFTAPDWISLAVGLTFAIGAAIVPAIIMPRFKEAFDSLGVALPWPTLLFVNHPGGLWILPAAVSLAWLAWPNPRHRALAVGFIGVAGSALVIAVFIVAMYLPIFLMPSAL